eukprot:XP_014617287.1 AUGMIN subunit 3 [Glycine max]
MNVLFPYFKQEGKLLEVMYLFYSSLLLEFRGRIERHCVDLCVFREEDDHALLQPLLLMDTDDSLSVRNLQMNGVLERIASKAHELAHYHSGDEDGIYLAYSDFNQFLLGDSSCLKELNQWFAKQLDTFTQVF